MRLPATENKYSYSMDNFRAIAILLIIFGHCLYIDRNLHTYMYYPNDLFFINFLKGNTALFVFITGYLTPMVFWKKGDFNYQIFMNNKVKKILIPYIAICSFAFLFFSYSDVESNLKVSDKGLNYYLVWINYIATGDAFAGYWYIPFIFLFFILTPLYKKIYDLKSEIILLLFFLFLFISLIVHRPHGNDNPFHSLIYYTCYFLLGFYVNKNKDFFLKKAVIITSFFSFLFFSLVLFYSGGIGNQYKDLLELKGFDIIVLTKVSFILFIFGFLEVFLSDKVEVLSYISNISFPLYFIHAPIIYFFSEFVFYDDQFLNTRIWGCFLFFIIVLLFSVTTVLIIKKTLKRKSRFLIGG